MPRVPCGGRSKVGKFRVLKLVGEAENVFRRRPMCLDLGSAARKRCKAPRRDTV